MRPPIRKSPGTISRRNSTYFSAIFGSGFHVNPVMFAPRRARVAMYRRRTGSDEYTMTMGTLEVTRLTASTTGLLVATMTSGLSRTSSPASSGSLSYLAAANRHSTVISRPSVQPSAPSASWNTSL